VDYLPESFNTESARTGPRMNLCFFRYGDLNAAYEASVEKLLSFARFDRTKRGQFLECASASLLLGD
jgi:hypothetical protein